MKYRVWLFSFVLLLVLVRCKVNNNTNGSPDTFSYIYNGIP